MGKEIKIRDLRKKEKFVVDDEYLNGYAKLCGWKATLVYMSLCRHADKDQYSFPSIKHMAEQHGVSRDTIISGTRTLEKWGIVVIDKKDRRASGTWLCNGYTLTDKSEWAGKTTQVDHSDMANQVDLSVHPSRPQRPNQVDLVDSKETHIKETHRRSASKNKFFDDPLKGKIKGRGLSANKDKMKQYDEPVIDYDTGEVATPKPKKPATKVSPAKLVNAYHKYVEAKRGASVKYPGEGLIATQSMKWMDKQSPPIDYTDAGKMFDLIEQFLASKKAEEHGVKFSVCFSTATIGAWMENRLK